MIKKKVNMNLNTKLIALKQFFAFSIDLTIVSLPLLIFLSLDSAFVFWALWAFYIPFCEYKFRQTIGMKIVGTKIYSNIDLEKVSFRVVFRRHIARISMIWGVVGWLFIFFGKPLFKDYVIVYKNYTSNDGTIESAPRVQEISNKVSYAFLILLIIAFIFAYLRDEHRQNEIEPNTTIQNKEKSPKIICKDETHCTQINYTKNGNISATFT